MAEQCGKPMKRVVCADGSVVLLPYDAVVHEPWKPGDQIDLDKPLSGTW